MSTCRFIATLLSIIFISYSSVGAQNSESSHKWRLGFNYGEASQDHVPTYNNNYIYQNSYYKFQISREVLVRKWLTLEILAEPGVFFSEHQLLNEHFVTPDRGEDFLEQRLRFTQHKSFHEYVLNIGLYGNLVVTQNVSIVGLASTGPMWGTIETERLQKGLAFSDLISLGVMIGVNDWSIEMRATLRHNSNADLFKPNDGHNSAGLEVGISKYITY